MLKVEEMLSYSHGNGPISGMGSPDDEIAVLLQSSHASATPASLAGVMASVTRTSQDMFASHCPVPPYPGVRPLKFHHGSLARTSSMSSAGAGQNSWQHDHKADQQHQRWPAPTPVHGDEKWMLDAKGEVLDMHTKPSFEAVYDSFTPMMHPAPAPDATPAVLGVGLHRYHSAPSAFLQAVADDAFSQIPPPLDNSTMDSTFGECGLPPITEQTDMERMDSGNSVVEFEQFLSFDSDFSKRAAMSALGVAKSENGDTFANLFPPAKETVSVREKGIPIAEKVVPKQEIITIVEEQHSEDSNSGTSEDNSLVNGFNAAMYSQDDIFRTDSITSMPTFQGKRQRGFAGEFDSSSGSELNSKSYRFGNNQSTGLIRHVSLPTSGEGLNMDSNPDNHYVQMRLRAKRGCATHPRSIAERVRRTRISERMKKLQDLVPNMEKTTNTATMLDETMDYVRSLQNKITELQESIVQLKAGAAQIKSS